jgi:O-antigen/teichoic acid export membrane protein
MITSTQKSHLLLFIINRYFNYGLLFIRGIVLAKFLGPYYFGVWGFLTLLLQYFSFSSLGINYAITVHLSTDIQFEKKDVVPSMALLTTTVVSIGIILVGVIMQSAGVSLFPRFEFDQYLILVVLIIALSNIQQILINIYRVKKGLRKIALIETISAIILLVSALVFREGELIKYQLIFMVLSGSISLIILCLNLPFRIQLIVDISIIRSLFKIGLPLLIYNFFFYLITISARTIVNAFYSIEILGFYTLANSIAFAVLLGFQSIGWAIYPNTLSKTSSANDPDSVRQAINKINLIYNTGCYLLIFIVIAVLPLLFLYLPVYRSAQPVITILLLSQAVLSASFGYNALAIAQGQQKKVARISIIIVIIIVALGVVISLLNLNFIWIALSVLFGSILYSSLQVILGTKLLGLAKHPIHEIGSVIPISFLMASGIVLFANTNKNSQYWYIAALVVFFIFDYKKIFSLFHYAVAVLRK